MRRPKTLGWLTFGVVFAVCALPPLLMTVFSRPPKALRLVFWLWADFFGSWDKGGTPMSAAVAYAALAAALGCGAAWVAQKRR